MRGPKVYFHDFINFLFPLQCVACKKQLVKGEEFFCISCFLELPKTQYHLYANNPVLRSFTGRFPLEKGAAWLQFQKGGVLQAAMHAIKYQNRPKLGAYLASKAAADWQNSEFFSDIDLIVPVPLHWRKRMKRGYNQAAFIAQGLGDSLNIPVDESFLYRAQYRQSQTREHRFKRWTNVSSVFAVKTHLAVTDKHILLVDDVLTTGATIEACLKVMAEMPRCRFSIFTLAHA
jgi:ComF family protein